MEKILIFCILFTIIVFYLNMNFNKKYCHMYFKLKEEKDTLPVLRWLTLRFPDAKLIRTEKEFTLTILNIWRFILCISMFKRANILFKDKISISWCKFSNTRF